MTDQKSYYKVRLGPSHRHADECYEGGFIGVWDDGFGDLSNDLPEDWRVFNKNFCDKFLEHHPSKGKIAAGLACGTCWSICKGIKQGDIVLCPNGQGGYWIGEVISDYLYEADSFFPHQRKINWLPTIIAGADMSLELKKSADSRGTYAFITKHAEEIEGFISGISQPQLIATDESVEDAYNFALEKHLEDFLVQNWKSTELGQKYDILEDEGEFIGRGFSVDSGFIDILAISKDKKEFLVIELKKGRANDVVVGQILRYMGDVEENLVEAGQEVRGIIIALKDGKHLNRALKFTNNIDFYEYNIDFKLSKK